MRGQRRCFTFPYYGKRIATLIQSPWMYVDVMTSGVERAYALNPSFRRERSATNIHLVEIWQLQVDMAWMTNDGIMDVEEGLVRALAYKLQEHHSALYEQAGLTSAHVSALREPCAHRLLVEPQREASWKRCILQRFYSLS